MIHNRQGIDIPGRNLAVISVSFDAKELQENQTSYSQVNTPT